MLAAESPRPLSIKLISINSILGGLLFLLILDAPIVIFGLVLPERINLYFNLTSAMIWVILGVGLWQLNKRAWLGVFILTCCGLLNGLLLEASPAAKEAILSYQLQKGAEPSPYASPVLGAAINCVALFFLFIHKNVFDESDQ